MNETEAVDRPTVMIVIVTLPSGFKQSHYDVRNIYFDGTGSFSFQDPAGYATYFSAGEYKDIETLEVQR